MSGRIALIGFVNTEEILADKIKQQTPSVQVDGYEVLPNEAFGRTVDNRYRLYGVNDEGEFGFHHLDELQRLRDVGYAAINLGPIPAAMIVEDKLVEVGNDYVGPRRAELTYELDKSLITEIFPEGTGILPPTCILETASPDKISETIDGLGGDVVLKFVGEYPQYYQDSETRRVRMIGEFTDSDELQLFVTNSIDASGKVVIQKRIHGQQFSYTAVVDGNEGLFRLGENICYKHRNDGETGPLCDGTGALAINNTLPDLLSPEEIEHIELKMVRPYVAYLGENLGRNPKTFLNLDLIKSEDGKIYLLEVNNREPGGHTMANLLSGLDTPLIDVLQGSQEGRLREVDARFKKGASVVVSAYPENFPMPFEDEENRPRIEIPKLKSEDRVRMYTGWVDVEEDNGDLVVVRPRLSPTMLFVNHSPTVEEAANNVYERIRQVVPKGFDYRKDIGCKG
jgi:phosphoribosylamine-glycine ligase